MNSDNYVEDMTYKEISKKLAYNGRRIKVEELEYLNGDKLIYREHVKAGSASVILPITENDEVIMIRETRTPIGKLVTSLPAGMIEEGEEAEKAAIRELEEETGYKAERIEFLREYYSSIGYTDEKVKIYLATNMKKTQQHLDEEEDIEVVKIPIEKMIDFLEENTIKDASTTIALMHYLIYKRK